jgi:hypothetical protein
LRDRYSKRRTPENQDNLANVTAADRLILPFELPANSLSEIAERNTIKELGDKGTPRTSQFSSPSNTPPSPVARLGSYTLSSDGSATRPQGGILQHSASTNASQHCHTVGSPTSFSPDSGQSTPGILVPQPLNVEAGRQRTSGGEVP